VLKEALHNLLCLELVEPAQSVDQPVQLVLWLTYHEAQALGFQVLGPENPGALTACAGHFPSWMLQSCHDSAALRHVSRPSSCWSEASSEELRNSQLEPGSRLTDLMASVQLMELWPTSLGYHLLSRLALVACIQYLSAGSGARGFVAAVLAAAQQEAVAASETPSGTEQTLMETAVAVAAAAAAAATAAANVAVAAVPLAAAAAGAATTAAVTAAVLFAAAAAAAVTAAVSFAAACAAVAVSAAAVAVAAAATEHHTDPAAAAVAAAVWAAAAVVFAAAAAAAVSLEKELASQAALAPQTSVVAQRKHSENQKGQTHLAQVAWDPEIAPCPLKIPEIRLAKA